MSHAVSAERLAYEIARRGHETALIAGDWPELSTFRDRANGEITTALQQHESREIARRNPVSGRTERMMVSNGGSIGARVVAINASLRDLDDLRLGADRRELPSRLDRIADSWPKVEPVVHPVDPKEAAA